MEGVVCNSSSANIQNEAVILNIDGEVASDPKAVLPSRDTTPNKDENLKTEEAKGVNGHVISDPEPITNGSKSFTMSGTGEQKAHSPTLIGSAIKAVKNLFSPDKTKSKPVNVLSPVKQQRSASGSPCSSIYTPGNGDIFSSQPRLDILNSIQPASGESNFKNHLQIIDLGGTQSPLPFEHNNTDESFLTTVSLIDESFHSAVTHLDEHGDALKNGANFVHNILNNSQNLDLVDPYNDTLDNNESYLENTTLKNGSFTPEGTKCSVSILNTDSLNSAENSCFFNKNYCPDGSGKTQGDVQENERSLVHQEQLRSSNEENADNLQMTPFTATFLPEKINGIVEMAHLFLNKSFEEPISSQKKEIEMESKDEVMAKESEINFEGSNDEQEGFVANSISTTTIVLNSDDAVDLDNMLMSLKGEDLEGYTPSVSSLDDATYSLESLPGKPPSNEVDRKLKSADSSSSPATTFSPLQDKKSVSEGNSPTHTLHSGIFKLNKSDELINCRVLNEPLEGKRKLQEKNHSVDISLMKNSEASEVTKEMHPFDKVTRSGKENQSGENELPSNKLNSVPVISQQSYTILTHDSSLNRPVIEPISIVKDFSEKQTFQSDATLSTDSEMSYAKNCKNTSFSAEDLAKSQMKQSTPIWESNGEGCQKFFRPTALKLSPPVTKKHTVNDSKETENVSVPAHISPVNTPNDVVFPAEMETNCSADFDPNITRALQPMKEVPNKIFRTAEDASETSTKVLKMNQTYDKKQRSPGPGNAAEKSPGSQSAHKLNQTFRRKSLSPGPNIQNQAKQTDATGHKLNQTFDKSSSPKSKNFNSTFIKKRESNGETAWGNQTFDIMVSPEAVQINKTYDKSPSGIQMNETFDKKSTSMNKTEVIDKTLEISARNQTYIKETENEGQETNNTYDKGDIAEIASGMLGLELESDGKLAQGSKACKRKPKTSDGLQPLSKECETSGLDVVPSDGFQENTSKNTEPGNDKDGNESFSSAKSSNTSVLGSDLSMVLLNEEFRGNQSIDDLSEKLGKVDLGGDSVGNQASDAGFDVTAAAAVTLPEGPSPNLQAEEKLLDSLKADKLPCDPDLVQLIQEQFSPNDIEKICSVVQDMSSLKLSSDILRASEQFDKSFHGNVTDSEFKLPEAVLKTEKTVNPLSPQSFDFLSSIRGKPTGRDLSRESLYVKFDPLVQPSANSLIDFTKEGEAPPATDTTPPKAHNTSICEQLLTISPQKKPDEIVPPLTPLSHKVKTDLQEDKSERLKELQNEIYFLKNLYAERERTNRTKMEDYESQIAKLTGQNCFLEDKLKESNEREKSLVKKMKEQNESIGQLKVIMEEYIKVISKLTTELETLKKENTKQVENLSVEKDSYMTHLQNTEAAFTDVHLKYEKSKKTIVSLKTNEAMYRNTIAEQAQKLEEMKQKAREAQEKALVEFQKAQEELSETKSSHAQETARLRAQLRKTELKVEALQDSLDQKMKENQQLTAICDELIEGKK